METSGTAKTEYKGTDRFTDVNKYAYKFGEKKFVSKCSYFQMWFNESYDKRLSYTFQWCA